VNTAIDQANPTPLEEPRVSPDAAAVAGAVTGDTSDLLRWLRPWAIAAVAVVTLVTVVTGFAEDLPTSHHVAVPIAAAVMASAWVLELSAARVPRIVLIATVVPINMWLTLIGHLSANFLSLTLLVAWVGVVGRRAESVLALILSLATVGAAVAVDAARGPVAWSAWTSWAVGLLIVWVIALVLRRQAQLVLELRLLRSEAEQRGRELETLLGVSPSIASTLDMNPLTDGVLDALGSVVDYTGTAILTLDDTGDTLAVAHWARAVLFHAGCGASHSVSRGRLSAILGIGSYETSRS
jgi:hypothetical protein